MFPFILTVLKWDSIRGDIPSHMPQCNSIGYMIPILGFICSPMYYFLKPPPPQVLLSLNCPKKEAYIYIYVYIYVYIYMYICIYAHFIFHTLFSGWFLSNW